MNFKPIRTLKFHRVLFTITMILALVSMGQVGFAYNGVAPWYENGIAEAQSWRIIPDGFEEKSFNEPITRGEFAQAVVLAYLSATGELPIEWEAGSFEDENDAFADVAKALNIVSGYQDGTFKPEGLIRREEIFVMIHKLISKLDTLNTLETEAAEHIMNGYVDANKVSLWALNATAVMVERKIISGTDKGTLDPKSKTTRAQALVILNNALNTVVSEPVTAEQMTYALEKLKPSNGKETEHASNENKDWFNWPKKDEHTNTNPMDFDAYMASLSSSNLSRGGGRDHRTLEEIYTPEELMVMLGENSVKYALVFGSAEAVRYQTADEALKHMVTVSFDVWTIGSNGSKTTMKRSVTVNRAIAETVKLIFKEIYEGPEKFPIKNVGGYAWRASETSEHRWGLAIDINSNENYMIRTNGTVVAGSYWKPGIDPYSIKPDGDVVNAFKKYGFSWGGNAWSMSNDYMHFSFLGK